MNQTNFILDNFYHYGKTRADEIYLRQPLNGKWIDLTWKDVGIGVRKLAQKITDIELGKEALLSKNCAHWIISD
jgi:long-subunit acyl-CoA synthetase (AMP-forming)